MVSGESIAQSLAKFAKDRGYQRLSTETNGRNFHSKHFESMQTCETPSVSICLKLCSSPVRSAT
jgi:hypothetical protein